MTKFCKKPIEVEAMQFFYDGERVPGVFYPFKSDDGKTYIGDAYVITIHGQRAYLQNGDWVITEPDGEHHYPCKPDIFEATYEAVNDMTPKTRAYDFRDFTTRQMLERMRELAGQESFIYSGVEIDNLLHEADRREADRRDAD